MKTLPYVPGCQVNGVECCAHHARRNTPVTPSQLARMRRNANYYAGKSSDREAFDRAEAEVTGIYDARPTNYDWNPDRGVQPEKFRPEGYR